MMLIVFLSIYLIPLPLALLKFVVVEKCPLSENRWMEREKEFGCSRNKTYHCILTSDDQLVELCKKKQQMKSGGCPHVYVNPKTKTAVTFVIPNTICSPTVKGCPGSNRTVVYYSNELYRYPMCLKPEKERVTLRGTSTVSTLFTTSIETYKTSSTQLVDSKVHLNINLWILIPFLILAGIAIVMASVAVHLIRNRNPNVPDNSTNVVALKRETDSFLPEEDAGNPSDVTDYYTLSTSPQDEYRLQAHLLFKIAKGILWNQVSFVKREDRNWKDILEQLKHNLYHQWKSDKCCYCHHSNKRQKRIWSISEDGWCSLYQQRRNDCRNRFKICACLYDSKDITIDSVSMSTLFAFTLMFGEMSNECKRHLKSLRQFCKEFFRVDAKDAKTIFTEHLENAINNVAFHSRFHLVKQVQTDIEHLRNGHTSLGRIEEYAVDFKDKDCLADLRLADDILSLIVDDTKKYIEDEDFFVELDRITEKARQRLKRDKLLIVSGEPGDGRKSLCKRLLKTMDMQKATTLKLNYFQVDFDFFRKSTETYLVYFEDILGSSLFYCLGKHEKQDFMKNVKTYLDLAKDDVFTLCSIENSKLKDALSDLDEQEQNFWKRYAMDISSKDLKLNENEIRRVLDTFGKEYPERSLGEKRKEEVVQSASRDGYFGFFEICVLYFKFERDHNLFFHPLQGLLGEIDSLKKVFNDEYIILIYMLFTDEVFDVENHDSKLFQNLRLPDDKCRGQNVTTKNKEMYNDVIKKATRNSKLLLKIGPTTYTFQHQFVKEAVLQFACQHESEKLLDLANASVIKDFVRPSTYKRKCPSEVIGLLDKASDRKLAQKILKTVEMRKVPTYASTWDETFLTECLFKEMEKTIFVGKSESGDLKKALLEGASSAENDVFKKCVKCTPWWTNLP